MINKELKNFIKFESNSSLVYLSELKKWLSSHADNNIYLFGAGNHSTHVIKFLRQNGIAIRAILDTYCDGNIIQGIPVLQWDKFLEKGNCYERCRFVISAPSVSTEITKEILNIYPKAIIDNREFEMVFYSEYITNVEAYRSYLLSHWDEIEYLYMLLADDWSRVTLENVLKGRISGDTSYYNFCAVPNQYYPDNIITFSENEVMVELGSFDGATLQEFIRRCPNYRVAYCFEPEERFFSQLKFIKETEACKGHSVVIIQKGAWDMEGTLDFYIDDSLTGSGTFSLDYNRDKKVEIKTTTVDNSVSEPITFMKMDIEGSELRALHGAERQIVSNQPKLAISVYHKQEDLLDIWSYLRDLVPKYRFFLRHHMKNMGTETVLYAVP